MTEPSLGAGLRDKRVVVTGGASGIGLATARRFADVGAQVAVIDRDPAPDQIAGIVADVADPDEVSRAFGDVDEQLGGVDVLIANAGISSRADAIDIPVQEWRRTLDVNLSGIFHCSREAARRQRTGDGGTILMTASTNGITGHVGYAAYNASKAGVIALARTLALELAPSIRVNAICPGYVLTAMQEAEYTPEMIEQVNRAIPLGRHATPDEVAGLFVFLASDWGAYITGQAIAIDGGELA
jgi:meso-butanediol dehydrogenase / (S,S)-butanediol dehydrogenase / diacetyl reductase